MRTLHLTEHQSQLAVQLSSQTAASLQALCRGRTITPTWGQPGHFDLRPTAHVGVIGLPDLIVVIEPKHAIDRVLFLISYALDPAQWQSEEGLYGTTDKLVEAMSAIFAHTFRNALRQGVLQGYRATEEALTTVRGRVLLDAQLRRRYGAPLPLELAFDEYSVDTDLNRVLKAALHQLLRLPIRSAKVRQGLAVCSAALESIPVVEYGSSSLPAISWNRLNRPFKPAANIARMILEDASLEITAGAQVGTAFTIDMNKVFESFVRTALREALRVERSAFPDRPPPLALDAGERIHLVPDLLVGRGSLPVRRRRQVQADRARRLRSCRRVPTARVRRGAGPARRPPRVPIRRGDGCGAHGPTCRNPPPHPVDRCDWEPGRDPAFGWGSGGPRPCDGTEPANG
jgi:5-methylcytosine-specific restriction enzyme subunit McrC